MQYAVSLTYSNHWIITKIHTVTNQSRGNTTHSHGKIIAKYFALKSENTR